VGYALAVLIAVVLGTVITVGIMVWVVLSFLAIALAPRVGVGR
jgi:hypothetical protein